MKISDLNHLIVEWKDSVETGDRLKCQRTASQLSFYFSASKNTTGEQKVLIEKKAAEVFALLNPSHPDHFTEKMLEMVAVSMLLIEDKETIAEKRLYQDSSQCTIGSTYCLEQLSDVLKRSFPHICNPLTKEPGDNFEGNNFEKILAYQHQLHCVEGDPLIAFSEFNQERLEKIKELEKALFAPPDLFERELCFEHIAFDPAHPDQRILSLRESKEIVLNSLSQSEKKMIQDEDIVVFLAAARLYLQRFYEAYPEMILSRKVDLRDVCAEAIPPEFQNAPQEFEIDYGKHLKVISLWVAIKALGEIRTNSESFIKALIPKVLEKDFAEETGLGKTKEWLRDMERAFLKAIAYDTSFESLPLAKTYLDEISQGIAQEK